VHVTGHVQYQKPLTSHWTCVKVLLLVVLFPISFLSFCFYLVLLMSWWHHYLPLFTYSSQSPDIALLSWLLRTLGIVSYITLNILSCLLRTLALSVHLWFTCNFAGVFCHVLPTYSITGYGPRPLDALQTSTLITMSISAPTLTKANNALLPASCSSQHPKSFSISVLPCRAHSAMEQTANNAYNELHA
jgi:hypothetical protein